MGLEKFETEPAILPLPHDRSVVASEPDCDPSSTASPAAWYAFFASQTAKVGSPDVSKAVDAPAEDDAKIARGLRKHRPRLFVVNPRDAEEVSLRAAPRSDSAEVRSVARTARC